MAVDERIGVLTGADRQRIGFFADLIEQVVDQIRPSETLVPGAQSMMVAALVDVAARLLARCPEDLRGQAIETFQNQMQRNAALYAAQQK